MTQDELISKQALRIADLEEENKTLFESLKSIRSMIVCIGGPLNDNKLEYSPAQLVIFQRIIDCT